MSDDNTDCLFVSNQFKLSTSFIPHIPQYRLKHQGHARLSLLEIAKKWGTKSQDAPRTAVFQDFCDP